MRILFGGDAGLIEHVLGEAQEELRYLWCSELCRMPAAHLRAARWCSGKTAFDTECDRIVLKHLDTLDLGASALSEESSERFDPDAALSFLIDPLDATHNAYAGYPAFTSSVAAYRDGKAMFAWVYDMSRDVAYVAVPNGGAYMKTALVVQRIHASNVTQLEDAAVSFLRPRRPESRRSIEALLWRADKVRLSSCSSLDLCLIASGALDVFLDISEPGHQRSCDIAAAGVILLEAGGMVLWPDGASRVITAPGAHSLSDYGPLLACGCAQIGTQTSELLKVSGGFSGA